MAKLNSELPYQIFKLIFIVVHEFAGHLFLQNLSNVLVGLLKIQEHQNENLLFVP